MRPPYEDQNRPIRGALRMFGIILTAGGGILSLIGLVDFFSSFGTGGMPTRFWCLFVGLPLVGIGTRCLKAGFMGAIGKYVAGENVPTVSESTRYIAQELRPTIKDYARDLKFGSHEEETPVERMKNLEELKSNGLISDAEYQAKRAKILHDL